MEGWWAWEFPRDAAAAARAERAAHMRRKRAAREEQQRVAMARSAASEPDFFPDHLPAAPPSLLSGEEEVTQVLRLPQLAPAPAPLPARRLHFRQAPPRAASPPPSPTRSSQQYHQSSLHHAAVVDNQFEQREQQRRLYQVDQEPTTFRYVGQYFHGLVPTQNGYGFGAATSASGADGYQARVTRTQHYFAAEHDAPVNAASPASSALSTTLESFRASQARPAAPKRRRQTEDLLALFGMPGNVVSETADNFSHLDGGASSSSSAAAHRKVPPLLLEHFMEVDLTRHEYGGWM